MRTWLPNLERYLVAVLVAATRLLFLSLPGYLDSWIHGQTETRDGATALNRRAGRASCNLSNQNIMRGMQMLQAQRLVA